MLKQITNSLWVLAVLVMAACTSQQIPEEENVPTDLTQYVDPQIGSVHGRWFFYTPAALPFGMAKLAPHTNAYNSQGGWGPNGYDDRHTSIEGFGHFHEFQIGGLVYMPTVGDLQTVPGTLEDPDAGYRSRFDKASETSAPGYYAVTLSDYGIRAELTATERVGYQRFTFPQSEQAHVIIDIGHKQGESSDVINATARLVNDHEVEGSIVTYPEYVKFGDTGKRVSMYFVARLSKKPANVGTFVDTVQTEGETSTEGVNNGLYLSFNTTEGEIIEVQTGLSFTSIENARLNLRTETEGKDFDAARLAAQDAWNQKLNKIVLEGGKEEDRIKFYTGLYHALLGRGLSSDVNGDFPQVDDKIGKTPLDKNGNPEYHHYNTDGMWGGFWNLSQLWALAYPKYFSEYLQSNIDFYKDRGWLHDGAAAGTFTNGVSTNFQGLLIASAYNVGIRDFDVETGYEAAIKNELDYRGRDLGNGKYDLSYFVKDHFVPYQDTLISNGWVFNFGGSHTMEYSFSSYAVAQMAKQRGDSANYQKLMAQADYYRNLFDQETKYIRPKLKNGSFIKDFDPLKAWEGFQEGNAYQYTWYVPHDPVGLIELMGKETFNERLQSMFLDAEKNQFGGGSDEIDSFSGIEKLYNHGNQPSLHNAWLFNYSGKPWLTQKWVREICNTFYGTEPLRGYGVGQDEDQGQLGSWYVLASMGLFDVQGHTADRPSFQFGSPMFEKITIQLDEDYYTGKELIIETKNLSDANMYIQSVSWNGEAIDKNWIYRDQLMEGGTLSFTLGEQPNKNWGVSNIPPSMSNQK
ncbi:putative alpha-1,2-mannosidase [Catalinimonas alkaloidigena]|uniref:GH92 family glycosyl hydrolase n=1 Tax=Catalinimonas alkaloidigena TaxID=1075417 RepID=UPI00240625CD|nr:GH92 family glycosyl hydrolase [Catalinimonas alkaloidigena]MDF9796483.1 putative alpha-1,2-mannosidase [Catalinimonas alkaloidigena]